MCGYDPFYWYEKELDRDYEAYLNGYDNYDEYHKAKLDDLENEVYEKKAGK